MVRYGLQSALGAGDLLTKIRNSGLDASVLSSDAPRWERLRFEPGSRVAVQDRLLGALIGGAIGDAMGRAIEASGRHDDWIAEFKEKYGLSPEMGI